MTDETLEQRITRLEDLEAIKQLKSRYCEICDDNHNQELITTIFTEDGIWGSHSYLNPFKRPSAFLNTWCRTQS